MNGKQNDKNQFIPGETEQKQTEKELRAREEILMSILETTLAGFWDWNLVENTEYLSPAFKRMFGYEDHEMENSPEAWQSIIFSEDLPGVLECFDRHVKSGGREPFYNEVRYRHKDGSTVWVICTGQIIEWAKDGTPIRMIGCHIDITERKRAENVNRLMFDISNAVVTVQNLDDLYQSIHTALGRVMDVTNFFIAIVDMQKRTLYFPYHVDTEDDDFIPITDFDPITSLTGLVVTECKPVLYKKEELEKRAQKNGIWGPVPLIWMGTPLMIEDEVIGIVGVQSYTDPDLYSEQDLRVLAAVSDQMASAIARKRSEEELSSHLAFEKMVSHISSIFINLPPEELDRGLIEALKTVGLFFGADRSYLYSFSGDGKTYSNTHNWCSSGVAPYFEKDQNRPFDPEPCWESELFKGNIVVVNDVEAMPPELEADKQDFQLEQIQSLLTIPLVKEDKVFGCFGLDHVNKKHAWTENQVNLLQVVAELFANAIARHKNEETIRYLSYHDQLTGLYNRHFLEEEMQRFDTERQLPISIIMADLNGLKLLNDTYGHQTGDEMLKRSAAILKSVCREDDLLARFGGDEFLLYLPRTPEREARKISERIEKACSNELIKDVPLSLSTGVAVKAKAEQELAFLLREAEDNMYRDKLTESRSGKSAIVNSLLQTLAAKSFETEAHTRNMQEAAKNIGEKLGLPRSELHRLQLLITLHDIGKINIPEELLTKKGSLSAEEWEIMKKHSETGYRIAKGTDSFAHVAEDILAHHERWDGSGYPQGLKGEEIPLLARITTVVDAYEVMSNGRPYKKAMSRSEIVAELKNCSGTHFDPELVELFLSILDTDR